MAGSYIVAGARTPIGKMSGALSSFSAADLGGFAIKAALERAGVKPELVEQIFMGNVLQAGVGQAAPAFTLTDLDGRKVALIMSKDGSPDVYVCNIDGSGLIRLTRSKEDESSPCWSPCRSAS